MIPVPKSQELSESLGFVHTDRFPNGSASDRSSVHTELLSVPYIRSSKGPAFGPAKCRNNSGPIEHLDR